MPSTSHLSSSCICSCATSKCVRSTGGEHTSEYLCRLLCLGLKVESSTSKILYHLSPRGGYLPRCFPPRSPAPQMPIADQLHHHPEMKGASRETWRAPYAQAYSSKYIEMRSCTWTLWEGHFSGLFPNDIRVPKGAHLTARPSSR